ncbi:response regulator [Nocardioides rubriscoriae]|uniref:response regulator n=1 Tax=Nocardioides rubriscoriae TaxID=642762 RepID=UPI0011DFF2F7|nr:response regulator [Nocardioides rubriscoriae]
MQPSVLVIGHDADRLQATCDALALGRLTNPVVACRDASDARDYVLGRPPYDDRDQHPLPAVVVTDLHLGEGSGLDVLRLVRSHLSLRRTPVIVVADEAEDHEITEVQHLGAAAFLAQHLAADVLLGVIRDTGVPWSVGRVEAGA